MTVTMSIALLILRLGIGLTLAGHQRFIGQIDIGGILFDKAAQTIELLGTEVAPVLRPEMAKAQSRLERKQP